MFDIMEELDTANNLLQAALDRYLSACSAFQGCYTLRRCERIPRALSHRVTDELMRIDSHEMRFKGAKAAISLSRNCCADIVPISALPDEILGRIFRQVLGTESCTLRDQYGSQSNYLKYISLLSHVCSRWRQISISLGALWSHIDLNLDSTRSEKSLARAVVYAARARHSPLEVHVVDIGHLHNRPEDNSVGIAPFLASIAPRIRSLKLTSKRASNKSYPSTLRACLANCVPGVLTQLVLERPDHQFFEAVEEPQIPGSLLINLPKEFLEDIWNYLQVLQLQGIYPPWTSKAYSGLSVLHLLSSSHFDPRISASEQQIIEILRSSPQLRVFHFSLAITDPLPADASITPAHLECLEVLVWKSSRPNQLGSFLRLITPGSKSLRVSIDGPEMAGPVGFGEIRRFFARSNVAKLLLKSYDFETTPAGLLDLLPPLEVLALRGYDMPGLITRSTPDSHPSCIKTLYLLRCLTHFDELQRIIKSHSVQVLMIQRGDIFSGSKGSYSYWTSEKKINKRLHDICPVFKFAKEGPSMMKDWDDEAFEFD